MIPGIVGSATALPLKLGAALWLDAADTATITESGGFVSQWNDKSNNGRNFTQSTGANQPTTGTRTQNGLNVLDFNGNNALVGPTTPNLDTAPFEVFVACNVDVQGTWFSQTNQSTENLRQLQLLRTSTGSVTSVIRGSVLTNVSRSPETGRFRISGISRLSSGSSLRDGNTATALNIGSAASESQAQWRVGARGPNVSFPLDGTVGEVLLFLRELTTSERADALNYFATKWNIAL
jgi:hypothetical protein